MEKKVIFIIIGVIIVGAISSYLIYDMIGLKTEETGTENILQNISENKIENIMENETNISENIVENIQNEEPVEERPISSETNVPTESTTDKAKRIAREDHGTDEGVYYSYDGVDNDGRYIISVRDSNTTKQFAIYNINVETEEFSKREF